MINLRTKLFIVLAASLFPLLSFANIESKISTDIPEVTQQGQKTEISTFLEFNENYGEEDIWEFKPSVEILEKQGPVEKEFNKEKVEDPKGLKFNWNFIFEEPGEHVIGFKFEAYKNEEYKYTFDARDFKDISFEIKTQKEEKRVETISSKREEIKNLLEIDNVQEITEDQKSLLNEEIDDWEIAFESLFSSTNLTEKYVDNAETFVNELTGKYEVSIRFNPEGAELLKRITAKNIGNPLATYINGQKVQVATVHEEIPTGAIQISGSLNEEEAKQVAEKLGYADIITVEETNHQLEVNSSTGGNVVKPGEGVFNYSWGDKVELKANPNPGYEFTGWAREIDAVPDPKSRNTTITITEDYFVLGEFQEKKFPVAFIEKDGLENVSIEIYSYEDFTGKVDEIDSEAELNLESGKYWFIANLENYKNYEGSFEVENSDKNVNFSLDEEKEDYDKEKDLTRDKEGEEDKQNEEKSDMGENDELSETKESEDESSEEKKEDDDDKKEDEVENEEDKEEDDESEINGFPVYKLSTALLLIFIVGRYLFQKFKR